jgi:LysM repeat protein
MRRRFLFLFVLINIFVSLGVVLIAVSLLNKRGEDDSNASIPQVVTVQLVITATQDPNATPNIIIVTPTLQDGFVQLPTGLIQPTDPSIALTRAALPTGDPTLIAQAQPFVQDAVTALPQNCLPYTVQEGDAPFSIAAEYGVDINDLLVVNGLDEQSASFLQIGQVLIVPLEGCPLPELAVMQTQTATGLPSNTPTVDLTETTATFTRTPTNTATTAPSATVTPTFTATYTATASPTPSATSTLSATPTRTYTPSNTPSATLPPTAENAVVQIVRVIDAGNITAEGVEIRNNGPVIDLSGWTLSRDDETVYTFPNERRLFQGGSLTVFTRVGDDTPIALYWDRDRAVWSSGVSVTLSKPDTNGDGLGEAQSVFTIP